MTPIAELLHRAEIDPKGLAFVEGDGRWTYQRLAAQVERLSRGLAEHGVRKGDRVALHMPNRSELAVAIYACFYLGAIAVPLNNRCKTAELASLLQRLRPALYIGHADLYQHVEAVEASILPPQKRFVAGRTLADVQPWTDLLSDIAVSTPARSDMHSPAVLLATSGTTGLPKFVIHTQATIATTTDALRHFELTGDHTAMVVCPMVHAGGFFTFIGCISNGVPMVLLERFDPDAALDAIEMHRCSWLFGLPFMFTALLERQRLYRRDVYSLRFCLFGGDVCSQQLQQEFPIEFGVPLRNVWAASEAVGCLTYGLEPGPVSRIAPGAQVRLVGEGRVPVPLGEVGELAVRGPNVSIGYWAGPDVIDDAPENGWYHTGDLMRQDEKGNLWFVARKKDIIIRGGSNISPVEVERVLAAHPAVKEAAVVGIPDATLGQRVAGFVQLEKNAPSEIASEVLEMVRNRLADYKVPERLQVVATIPRNALGKTDRAALLAMIGHDGPRLAA